MNKKQLLAEKMTGKTYAEIAKEHGVSRQRIQQLLSPSRSIKEYVIRIYHNHCVRCGVEVGDSGHIHHKQLITNYQDIENLELLCISCHISLHLPPKFYHVCSYCNKSFHTTNLRARVKRSLSGLIFCSKICQGTWLGKTYKRGFNTY